MKRRSMRFTVGALLPAVLAACAACASAAASSGSEALTSPSASALASPPGSAPVSPSGSISASPPGSALASPPGSASAEPCSAGALALKWGPLVSGMTGEMADMYTISNHGNAACWLDGYPGVTLYDAQGKALAFRYTHGQSQYVTKAGPEKVVLPAGGSAFVLVAKYRCDLGDQDTAATIKLTLPGSRAVVLTGPVAPAGSNGGAVLNYCPGEGGSVVGVSPVEATANEATPFAG